MKTIRKAVKSVPLQYEYKKTTKLCTEGSGATRKLVLMRDGVKDCVDFPEGGVGLTCEQLSSCPIIVQIQGDISDIETAITNLQNATTVEAIQDIIAPMLVHNNHSGLTATYDDVNNQIILTVIGGGGGFTCADVATCIDSSVDTQTALLNWLQSLNNVTITGAWTFSGATVNFDGSIINYNTGTISNHLGDSVNYDGSTVYSENSTYTHDNDTINIQNSVINSQSNTYNHVDDTINYDVNTEINGGTFNGPTINNPVFTGTGATVKKGPITWTPAGSSLVITDVDSIATSVVNGDNITSGTPNGNYFVYDTSTPGQITVTSKDFLGNNISENGIVFYYTITY